jgi:1-acyl-sn-glycerol-3-phosphate acyltransferase
MLYRVLWFLSKVILKVLFRTEIIGRENIPDKGGFILAGNHISNLDPIALGVACPYRLNFMVKEELFANRLLSNFFSKLGCFPVKRGSADLSAIKEAIRRLSNNGVLCIFPEGRRQEAAIPQGTPHRGVGFLASKLGIDVLPAFVDGTDKILPRGRKFIRPGRIRVTFGKLVHVDKGMPSEDITESIMWQIRHIVGSGFTDSKNS